MSPPAAAALVVASANSASASAVCRRRRGSDNMVLSIKTLFKKEKWMKEEEALRVVASRRPWPARREPIALSRIDGYLLAIRFGPGGGGATAKHRTVRKIRTAQLRCESARIGSPNRYRRWSSLSPGRG